MTTPRWTRLLSLSFVVAAPLGVLAPACSSTTTSSVGQLISCQDTAAGVTGCHPADDRSGPGSGASTCEDIDDDGDGSPHDQGEDRHGMATGSDDRGDHGTVDDDDDDGDGIPNDRDCDKRHGGDDDPAGDDHGSGDDDGSGHT
jgi:hypothetical protein